MTHPAHAHARPHTHAPVAPPCVLLLLSLPLASCIEDRLTVDLHTQVHADGTCSRRVEYVLERVDTDRGGTRVGFTAEESPLALMHRFPSGAPWRVDEEIEEGRHRLVLEATLDAPDDFDGDFFRARHPRNPPARNFISTYTSPEDGVFEYYEVFRDPVSPLAVARSLARDVTKRDQEFARRVQGAFGDRAGAPEEATLRRAYLDLFAHPFSETVSELGRRPIFGPRERRALEEALEEVEVLRADLEAEVHSLAPAAPVDDLDHAVEAAFSSLDEALLRRAEEAGLPLFLGGSTTELSFRATLVLPYPIRRANTCAMGDTAVWEFEGHELYGRGFEMMALASAP